MEDEERREEVTAYKRMQEDRFPLGGTIFESSLESAEQ